MTTIQTLALLNVGHPEFRENTKNLLGFAASPEAVDAVERKFAAMVQTFRTAAGAARLYHDIIDEVKAEFQDTP